MSSLSFFKYQGAGNDFVMVDNRKNQILGREDQAIIEKLCDRHFGIGADGLILLQEKEGYDFEMVYFNADGRESSMCGNGGRCIVAMAQRLGLIEGACNFLAIDGPHEAIAKTADWVELKMGAVDTVQELDGAYFLDTGSPHYVKFVEEAKNIDVVKDGRTIRQQTRFQPGGTNVNFVQPVDGTLHVATYERGVEDETLACGTGVTAAALAYYLKEQPQTTSIPIVAKGGNLEVRFEPTGSGFDAIWLCGPAKYVYEGQIDLSKI